MFRNVCGVWGRDSSGILVLPITKFLIIREIKSYNHTWVSVTGDTNHQYSETEEREYPLIASSCSFEYRAYGSGERTRISINTVEDAQVWVGCGQAPNLQDYTSTHTTNWNYSRDTDVDNLIHITQTITQVGPNIVNHDCGSYSVNMWDGTMTTNTTVNTFTKPNNTWPYFTPEQQPPSEVLSYEFQDEVTWSAVLAAMHGEFDDECVGGSLNYTGANKTGTTYNGINYPDAPSSITLTKSKVIFEIPTSFGGSFYSIKYRFKKTSQIDSSVTYSSDMTVDWSGPGVTGDPNSWQTTPVDIPYEDDSIVTVDLIAFRCWSSGKWQAFS